MDSLLRTAEEMAKQWSHEAWISVSQGTRRIYSLAGSLHQGLILSLTRSGSRKRIRSRKLHVLPFPFPTQLTPLPSSVDTNGSVHLVLDVFEEVSNRLVCRIHDAHKNLQFWKARGEGTKMHKVRFMILERGPLAFIQGVSKLVRDSIWESSTTHGLVFTAVSEISKRMMLLSDLQHRLAVALGEVYREADRFGDRLDKGISLEMVSEALISIHNAIVTLQGTYDLNQSNHSLEMDIAANITLQFKGLPEEILEKKVWTDTDVYACVVLIRENLERLDDCLTILACPHLDLSCTRGRLCRVSNKLQTSSLIKLQNYCKPRKAVRRWLQYSGGAVGLALASGWVIRHSRLMGSHDIDNWLKQGTEAIMAFSKEHIEKPLMSIRDDLFETFRRRHHGAAELEDVQLTAESLQRMLRALTEQLKGREIANIASEQEMMEIVMTRYEQEITHPLQNLLGGELFRAILIQVQKLKLDIETAMLELNQILRANEINFAVLAALPAFLFAVILIWLLRLSLRQSKGAEGRGRASRVRRRMLLAEVERMIISYQILKDEGQEQKMQWQYGMSVYFLNQFYRAVEKHAVSSGEWSSLQRDILDLAKPEVSLPHKLSITARMERIYECIIPDRPSSRLL